MSANTIDAGRSDSLRTTITRRQWLTLVGTTLGWGLEGFDVSLFALIAVPAVKDLLGPDASSAEIRFHAGLGITIFLLGWTVGGLLLGFLSDYFGRVRILTFAVAAYAVFTALSAASDEFWQLAVLRFLAGLGSGVEAPVGAVLMAETWNNRYRARAIGIMMSGYAGGFFLASVAYAVVGVHGWRTTILLAVIPAVVAVFVRRFVEEPEAMVEVRRLRAERKAARVIGPEDRFVLWRLFSPPLLGRMLASLLLQTGALFAFWSVTTWTPTIITQLATADGKGPAAIVTSVSTATAMLNLGGVIGYATWGFIADVVGRRYTFIISFVASATGIAILFPFPHSYHIYLWILPLVGFGIFGALGGVCVYIPELFPTSTRVSALVVGNSVGRLLTAPGPLIAGSIASRYFHGNLGTAVTVIAALMLLTIIGALAGPETKGVALEQTVTPVIEPHLTKGVQP
ncbi:MFS transporter [Nocardia gamkensis]|uniref:MFS transporter n=1 Tax=Nocardia gamkensis TaxID=352869 RepID=UPI0037C7B14D